MRSCVLPVVVFCVLLKPVNPKVGSRPEQQGGRVEGRDRVFCATTPREILCVGGKGQWTVKLDKGVHHEFVNDHFPIGDAKTPPSRRPSRRVIVAITLCSVRRRAASAVRTRARGVSPHNTAAPAPNSALLPDCGAPPTSPPAAPRAQLQRAARCWCCLPLLLLPDWQIRRAVSVRPWCTHELVSIF